jgi:exoribonuclease R
MKRGHEVKTDAEAWSGILRVIASNRKTAYVTIPHIGIDILIPNEVLRNRAIHGDTVAISVLPCIEWIPLNSSAQEDVPTSRIETATTDASYAVEAEEVNRKLWNISDRDRVAGSLPISNARPLHPIRAQATELGLQPTAKVIAITHKSRQKLHVGSLSTKNGVVENKRLADNIKFVLFQPQDPRYPYLKVLRYQLPEAFVERPYDLRNHIFMAEIDDDWPTASESPSGINVRSVGEMGDIQAETAALCK